MYISLGIDVRFGNLFGDSIYTTVYSSNNFSSDGLQLISGTEQEGREIQPVRYAQFNGVDQTINIPLVNRKSTDISFCFWARTTVKDNSKRIIQSGSYIQMYVTSTGDFRVYDYTNSNTANPSYDLADAEWHFYSVKINSTGDITIRVDENYFTGFSTFSPAVNSVGLLNLSAGNFYDGDLKDFRIYYREITETEENKLFNQKDTTLTPDIHLTLEGESLPIAFNSGSNKIHGEVVSYASGFWQNDGDFRKLSSIYNRLGYSKRLHLTGSNHYAINPVSLSGRTSFTITGRYIYQEATDTLNPVISNGSSSNGSSILIGASDGNVFYRVGGETALTENFGTLRNGDYVEFVMSTKIEAGTRYVYFHVLLNGIEYTSTKTFATAYTDFSYCPDLQLIGYVNTTRYFAGFIPEIHVYSGYVTTPDISGLTLINEYYEKNRYADKNGVAATLNGTESKILIPPTSKSKDCFGESLTYPGKSPLNFDIENVNVYELNGVDQSVLLPNDIGSTGNSERTILIKAYFPSGGNDSAIIFAQNISGGTKTKYVLRLLTDFLRLEVAGGSFDSSDLIPIKDAWNDIAISYDGTNTTTYLNGETSTTNSTNVSGLSTATGNNYIGSSGADFKFAFAAIVDSALSVSEIDSFFNLDLPDVFSNNLNAHLWVASSGSLDTIYDVANWSNGVVVNPVEGSWVPASGVPSWNLLKGFNSILYFDGVDDEINFGDILPLADNDLILYADIIQPSATTVFNGGLIGKGAGNVSGRYILYSREGELSFTCNLLTSGTVRRRTGVYINDGKRHKCLVVFDRDSHIKIFLDGVEIDNLAIDDTDIVPDTVNEFTIGSFGELEEFFEGFIYKVAQGFTSVSDADAVAITSGLVDIDNFADHIFSYENDFDDSAGELTKTIDGSPEHIMQPSLNPTTNPPVNGLNAGSESLKAPQTYELYQSDNFIPRFLFKDSGEQRAINWDWLSKRNVSVGNASDRVITTGALGFSGNSDRTFFAWVIPTVNEFAGRIFCHSTSTAGTAKWAVVLQNLSLRIEIQSFGATSSLIANLNEVNKIAVSYNSVTDEHTFYLNGAKETVTLGAIPNTNDNGALFHFQSAGYGSNKIFNVGYVNRVLSEAEINNVLDNLVFPNEFKPNSNLAHLWTMAEGAGETKINNICSPDKYGTLSGTLDGSEWDVIDSNQWFPNSLVTKYNLTDTAATNITIKGLK